MSYLDLALVAGGPALRWSISGSLAQSVSRAKYGLIARQSHLVRIIFVVITYHTRTIAVIMGPPRGGGGGYTGLGIKHHVFMIGSRLWAALHVYCVFHTLIQPGNSWKGLNGPRPPTRSHPTSDKMDGTITLTYIQTHQYTNRYQYTHTHTHTHTHTDTYTHTDTHTPKFIPGQP